MNTAEEQPQKRWYRVHTPRGVRNTFAASQRRAVRNVCFRLVMGQRDYDRPKPMDLAEMRDIKILKVEMV